MKKLFRKMMIAMGSPLTPEEIAEEARLVAENNEKIKMIKRKIINDFGKLLYQSKLRRPWDYRVHGEELTTQYYELIYMYERKYNETFPDKFLGEFSEYYGTACTYVQQLRKRDHEIDAAKANGTIQS